MALEMRTECECCGAALAQDDDATICSYECTFCRSCAEMLGFVCPTCGGELVSRPKRVVTA